jgi:hypothetical protein
MEGRNKEGYEKRELGGKRERRGRKEGTRKVRTEIREGKKEGGTQQ